MKLSTAFYLMLLTLFVSPVLAQYATQDTVHLATQFAQRLAGRLTQTGLQQGLRCQAAQGQDHFGL